MHPECQVFQYDVFMNFMMICSMISCIFLTSTTTFRWIFWNALFFFNIFSCGHSVHPNTNRKTLHSKPVFLWKLGMASSGSSDSWEELAERIARSQKEADDLSQDIAELEPEHASNSWWCQLLKQHSETAGFRKVQIIDVHFVFFGQRHPQNS